MDQLRSGIYPRSDDRFQPKGFTCSSTQIGPVLEVMITKRFDRYGIILKIGTMDKDGTQFWMVTSRSADKYVTEFAVDHTRSIHYGEASSNTEKLSARKQRTEQLKASSFSSLVLPIGQ